MKTHVLLKDKSMLTEDRERGESPMNIQRKKDRRGQQDKQRISLRHREGIQENPKHYQAIEILVKMASARHWARLDT